MSTPPSTQTSFLPNAARFQGLWQLGRSNIWLSNNCDVSKETIRRIQKRKPVVRDTFETFIRQSSTVPEVAKALGFPTDWRDLIDPTEWPRVDYTPSPPPATEPVDPGPSVTAAGPPPAGDGHLVPLKELGLFLGKYADLTGLDSVRVAAAFVRSVPDDDQWQPTDIPRPIQEGDIKRFLEDRLYRGLVTDRVEFFRLQRLLHAFHESGTPNDMPALMAEWLCARPITDDHLFLRPMADPPEFSRPPTDREGRKPDLGVRCQYLNAPRRLDGMECAIVKVEFQPNVPHAAPGGRPIDRVTELLRNLGDAEAIRNVPRSHPHVHPGDEIVFVVAGTVFVQLENTGIWTPVSEGDYIHFNADIPHAVWNLADRPAVAVVIRFFQLSRHGTRYRQTDILRHIERLMRELSDGYGGDRSSPRRPVFASLEDDLVRWLRTTAATYQLWTEIAPWVHDRTRPPRDRLRHAGDGSVVQDLVGVSRFLLTYVADMPPTATQHIPELTELQQAIHQLELSRRSPDPVQQVNQAPAAVERTIRFKEQLLRFVTRNFDETTRAQVRSCFEGLPPPESCPPPNTSTLRAIGKLFQSDLPRVLLDGYLSPNALRVVTVRGATAEDPEKRDWVAPPPDENGMDARWATYRIPARTLANSDVSVVLLELRANGHTAWNRHPGFELIVPVRGSVRIEFDPAAKSADSPVADPYAIVVYRSSVSHRVVAVGSEHGTVRVLVIRFNIRDERRGPDSSGPAADPQAG